MIALRTAFLLLGLFLLTAYATETQRKTAHSLNRHAPLKYNKINPLARSKTKQECFKLCEDGFKDPDGSDEDSSCDGKGKGKDSDKNSDSSSSSSDDSDDSDDRKAHPKNRRISHQVRKTVVGLKHQEARKQVHPAVNRKAEEEHKSAAVNATSQTRSNNSGASDSKILKSLDAREKTRKAQRPVVHQARKVAYSPH